MAWANRVSDVGEPDLAQVRRIVAAARDAVRHGRSAFVVAGRMVDGPGLRRAEAVLARAHPGPAQAVVVSG